MGTPVFGITARARCRALAARCQGARCWTDMASMSSLHGGFGGKKSKKNHEPSEAEGFALSTASTAYRSLLLLFHSPPLFSRSFRFVHYVLIRNYDSKTNMKPPKTRQPKSLLPLKRSTHLISHCLIVRLSMSRAMLGLEAAAVTQRQPFGPAHDLSRLKRLSLRRCGRRFAEQGSRHAQTYDQTVGDKMSRTF